MKLDEFRDFGRKRCNKVCGIQKKYLYLRCFISIYEKMVSEGLVRESSLQVISNAQYGTLRELEERLGKREVRQLEAMGFIQNAPSKYGETWKISSRARRLAKLRSKPYTMKERRLDFFRFRLPKLLFGT